jgi:predicted TIM-barrel fold metal-dependent hydrolase
VLDHVGGPLGIGPYAGRRAEVFDAWRRDLAVLARCPNVFVKLGGLTMSLAGFGWHKRPTPPGSAELAEAMAPYYRACIELFGAERCMFESNFPIDRVSCPYTTLWNAFKRIAATLPDADRRALFHDTAARVYRLAA